MKKHTFSCGLTLAEIQAEAAERAAWGKTVMCLFDTLSEGHDLLIEPTKDDETGITGSTVAFLAKRGHGPFVETERQFSSCDFKTLKALVAAYVTIRNRHGRCYHIGGTEYHLSVFDVRNIRTKEEAIAPILRRVA